MKDKADVQVENNIRMHCNRCNRRTNHWIEKYLDVPWEEFLDDNFRYHGRDLYTIIRCMGCDDVAFSHVAWCSEDMGDNGQPAARESIYPPRISRSKPDWLGAVLKSPFWTGETVVEQLLKEIYTSLDNDCPRLAAMGIRALLEHMFVDKCTDRGSFTSNLEAFFDAGHISTTQRSQLQAVLEMGRAASHRAFRPGPGELKTAMDIAEQLIAVVYVHPTRATELLSVVPNRRRVKATLPKIPDQ